MLEVEHTSDGIRAFNIDPGHVPTERQIASGRAKQYEGNFTTGTPEAIGAAVACLCTNPAVEQHRVSIVLAQNSPTTTTCSSFSNPALQVCQNSDQTPKRRRSNAR